MAKNELMQTKERKDIASLIVDQCPIVFPEATGIPAPDNAHSQCQISDELMQRIRVNNGKGRLLIADYASIIYKDGTFFPVLSETAEPMVEATMAYNCGGQISRYINSAFHLDAMFAGGTDLFINANELALIALKNDSGYTEQILQFRTLLEQSNWAVEEKAQSLLSDISEDPAMSVMLLLDSLATYYASEHKDIDLLNHAADVLLNLNYGTKERDFNKATMITTLEKMISFVKDIDFAHKYPEMFNLVDTEIERLSGIPYQDRYSSFIMNKLIYNGISNGGVDMRPYPDEKNRYMVQGSCKPVSSAAFQAVHETDLEELGLSDADIYQELTRRLNDENSDEIQTFIDALNRYDLVRGRVFCMGEGKEREIKDDHREVAKFIYQLNSKGMLLDHESETHKFQFFNKILLRVFKTDFDNKEESIEDIFINPFSHPIIAHLLDTSYSAGDNQTSYALPIIKSRIWNHIREFQKKQLKIELQVIPQNDTMINILYAALIQYRNEQYKMAQGHLQTAEI